MCSLYTWIRSNEADIVTRIRTGYPKGLWGLFSLLFSQYRSSYPEVKRPVSEVNKSSPSSAIQYMKRFYCRDPFTASTGKASTVPICKHVRYIHTLTYTSRYIRTYVHTLHAYVHRHKDIPIQKWTGLIDFQETGLPEFLYNRYMKVVSFWVIHFGRLYFQKSCLILISVWIWIDSKVIVQPDRLSQWKIPMNLSTSRPYGL